jgi:hypothetical protein
MYMDRAPDIASFPHQTRALVFFLESDLVSLAQSFYFIDLWTGKHNTMLLPLHITDLYFEWAKQMKKQGYILTSMLKKEEI